MLRHRARIDAFAPAQIGCFGCWGRLHRHSQTIPIHPSKSLLTSRAMAAPPIPRHVGSGRAYRQAQQHQTRETSASAPFRLDLTDDAPPATLRLAGVPNSLMPRTVYGAPIPEQLWLVLYFLWSGFGWQCHAFAYADAHEAPHQRRQDGYCDQQSPPDDPYHAIAHNGLPDRQARCCQAHPTEPL